MKRIFGFLIAAVFAASAFALDGIPAAAVQWYINPTTGSIVGYRNQVTQHDTATLGALSFGALTATTGSFSSQLTATSVATGIVTNTAATYTVLSTDHTIIQTTAASVYTLPAASASTGRKLHLVTQFAGTVTSASANVVPLAGGAAVTDILAATAGKYATLQSNGTSWVIIAAN